MIILITLIGTIIAGVCVIKKTDYELFGFWITLVASIWIFIHLLGWGLKSYEYNVFETKRNAFEQTLKDARENGNQYESAAILKEVVEWNVLLAEYKYNNKTFLFDHYIDDRMELLEPIK